MKSFLACALALCGAFSAAAANQVFVVDAAGGPGVDHTSVQPAVDAAADGDVILVRPGTYSAFGVLNKAVSVFGDGSPRPVVESVSLFNVDPTRRVTLRRIEIDKPWSFAKPLGALQINSCQGRIVIEDCVIRGANASAAYVISAPHVMFTRCAFESDWVNGLFAANATVSVYESVIAGGAGQDATQFAGTVIPASPGQPAVVCNSSFVFVGGSSVTGGPGGNGLLDNLGNCIAGADGGPGALVHGINPEAFWFDTAPLGGAGGSPFPGCSNPGHSGPSVDVLHGSSTTLPGSLRTACIASPLREGQASSLDITGVPGEAAYLFIGVAPDIQFSLFMVGTQLPIPALIQFVGAIPASGSLSIPVTIPASLFPPGTEAIEAFIQVAVPGPLGQGVLGDGSAVVVVDGGL